MNDSNGSSVFALPITRRTITPGGVIGMLGGGQLGRMFAIAAAQLGYRIVVLADHPRSPAVAVADQALIGELTDRSLLDQLAERCDVVTLEFENIPAESVQYLAQRVGVYPSADVLRIAQDRGIEKQTLRDAGLPVTPFRLVSSHADAVAALGELGQPIVLKTTRDGYDGKGQWKIDSRAALDELVARPLGEHALDFQRPLIAEAWVHYQREVSVIIARGHDGETAVYPVFENRHRNHILDITLCPAEISDALARRAAAMAVQAAEAIELVGLICIEFFLDHDNALMINEIAPRPHNSGHLTIEACHTSQFEQQLRAVCGLPLGSTALHCPRAAMINVMGDSWCEGQPPDWTPILRLPGAHLHLYDKGEAKVGRKMGHITLTGPACEQAQAVRGGLLRQGLAVEPQH